MSKPRLGSGGRFKAIEKSAAASGARDPAAVAAAAGRAKYGEAKMEKVAEAGRRRHEHADMNLGSASAHHEMGKTVPTFEEERMARLERERSKGK